MSSPAIMNPKPIKSEAEREALQLENNSQALVNRVVVQLNAICKTATFDFAMSVGHLIISSFYSDDLNAWRSRGAKNTSFRKLARHPNLPMSPTALYRSVAMYELCGRLGITQWKHVSTSHIRLVLPLANDDQARLLQSVEVNAWPVRRLQEEIGKLTPRHTITTSRPPPRADSRLKETIRSLEHCIDASNEFVGAEDITADPAQAARIVGELIPRLRQACTRLEDRIRAAPADDSEVGVATWQHQAGASAS